MSLFSILLLLFAGTAMILFELFLFPSGIAAIAGIGLWAWGIYEAFVNLGTNWGWTALLGTTVVNGIMAWWGFNNVYKTRFAIKNKIDSRVNEFNDYGLKIGDEGRTITDLRPEGKAMFGQEMMSVWTLEGGFISAGKTIKVAKIAENKIFVNI